MKNKKIILNSVILLAVSLLLISFSSGYMRSTPQMTQYQSSGFFGSDVSSLEFSDNMCSQTGQDFIIQIAPFGCEPAVVRSDLLEEQNVPVYCQLSATKINPLIDVNAIDSLSITGELPPEVAGIGFQPAKAALGTKEQLNSPILNNIGYAIIVLKKQENSSLMSDYVVGNLTAKINYDIKNSFGIGKANFYLPKLSDEKWEEDKNSYGFWNGKGYVRAEEVGKDNAVISIYDGTRKLQSVKLNNGETSSKIDLPGFSCYANLELRLDDVENPDTRARFSINNERVEAGLEETFLQGKCKVTGVEKSGLRERVEFNCQEDDTAGFISFGNSHELFINPIVELEINKEKVKAAVGDFLYSDNKGNHFYLGYAGTKRNTGLEKDLKVVILGLPFENRKEVLSDKEIAYVGRLVKGYGLDKEEGESNLVSFSKETGEFIAGGVSNLFNYVVKGAETKFISYNELLKGLGGRDVKLIGFGQPIDKGLEGDVKVNYNLAMQDLDFIINNYATERVENTNYVYGEQSIYEKIRLAYRAEQKESVLDYCQDFEDKYPSSPLLEDLKSRMMCQRSAKLSSQETSSVLIFVNGESREIFLDGIYEPKFEEYGARVLVRGPNGNSRVLDLEKNQVNYLTKFRDDSDSENPELIQLVDLEDDAAKIRFSVRQSLSKEGAKETVKELFTDTKTLKLGVPESFGSDYVFTLQYAYIEKVAKVSVLPNIDDVSSDASFGFKIGIEDVSIELSPERTKRVINAMNKTLEDWQDKQAKVGNLTQGLRKTCLGVGAVLTVKNFFANLGGKGIARQNVMQGAGGWNEKCANAVSTKKLDGEVVDYVSVNDCLTANSGKIESAVENYASVLEKQNEKIEGIQEKSTKGGVLGEQVVDSEKFEKAYLTEIKPELKTNLKRKFPDGKVVIDNKEILVDDFVDNLQTEGLSIEDLKSLELNSQLDSEGLQDISTEQLRGDILKIHTRTSEIKKVKALQDSAKAKGNTNMPVVSSDLNRNKVVQTYNGYTATSNDMGDVDKGEHITGYVYGGKEYILGLKKPQGSDFYVVEWVYDSNGNLILEEESKVVEELKENVEFKEYDINSYRNKYNNAKVQYFETGSYEGLPAIVPFDTQNGWYAALKQTLPVGSNIASYDKSGGVNSFYLCNVGSNHLQEFNSGVGDDICRGVNLATGQSYSQFPGLSETESKKKIDEAVKAIEQASRAHKSGVKKVSILGEIFDVGIPAANIPDMQCQDFMSPTDCQILFNVCDPVICPSSRCNLGGAYPVQDVVQTGIIGGLTLCLPNFKEGIYLPICLSGINAGLQGYIGLMEDYRDCMQESLDTGKLVGICDEIYSVGVCEFFWRQAAPLAEAGIPKLIGIIFGKTAARGGGEYLTVQNSWDNAKKSLDFFTNYYSATSFSAFKARAVDEIGSLVCKNSISGVYPDTGNILDSLSEPQSPPQFHGRIDVIPLTTTTNPPTSHYKVFYHIFAGQGGRATYSVYLRSSSGGSYYQDVGGTRIVDQGYLTQGETISETKDFTAPEGYNELCINVNGQEECGFESVSTSFAANYLSDKYKQEQIGMTDIKTESECISGSASVYSLLTPSAQGAAEELVNPEIYNRGIIRICASSNPGRGSDALVGTEGERWVEVGYCDNQNMKCWLDSSTVEDVIKNTNIEDETLEKLEQTSFKALQGVGDYVVDFESVYDEIILTSNLNERISKIDNVLDKVYYNRQKARLLLDRAIAYGDLVDIGIKDRREDISKQDRDDIGVEVPLSEEDLGKLNELGIDFDYVQPSDCLKCKSTAQDPIGCTRGMCSKLNELLQNNKDYSGKYECVYDDESNNCYQSKIEEETEEEIVEGSGSGEIVLFPFEGDETAEFFGALLLDPIQLNKIKFVDIIGETYDGYRFYLIKILTNKEGTDYTDAILRVYLRDGSKGISIAYASESNVNEVRKKLISYLDKDDFESIKVGFYRVKLSILGSSLDLYGDVGDNGLVKESLFDKIKKLESSKISASSLSKYGGISQVRQDLPLSTFTEITQSGKLKIPYDSVGKIKVNKYIGEFEIYKSGSVLTYRAYEVKIPSLNSNSIMLVPADSLNEILIALQELDKPLWQIHYSEWFKEIEVSDVSGKNPSLYSLDLIKYGIGEVGTRRVLYNGKPYYEGLVGQTLFEMFRNKETGVDFVLFPRITIDSAPRSVINLLEWNMVYKNSFGFDENVDYEGLTRFEIIEFIAQTGTMTGNYGTQTGTSSGNFGFRFYKIKDHKNRYAILRVNMFDVDDEVAIATVGINNNGALTKTLLEIAGTLQGFKDVDREGWGELEGHELGSYGKDKAGKSILDRIHDKEIGLFNDVKGCTLFEGDKVVQEDGDYENIYFCSN